VKKYKSLNRETLPQKIVSSVILSTITLTPFDEVIVRCRVSPSLRNFKSVPRTLARFTFLFGKGLVKVAIGGAVNSAFMPQQTKVRLIKITPRNGMFFITARCYLTVNTVISECNPLERENRINGVPGTEAVAGF
jgi:hypothetical protein